MFNVVFLAEQCVVMGAGKRRSGGRAKAPSKKRPPIKIKHPGALTRKAHAAHMSVYAYAKKMAHNKKASAATHRQAGLYLNVFRPANAHRHKR